ncbi:GntR family transcriptional regulator [Hoeflea sp. WL0058]|uniref:GntR family transcriptional regulator n=1 Tax=Flavimaribacter sediminis TaxID=2865987 RepID=A0AAE2ZRM2_9HYPH|nr:GntR family transcriptional regulator [Flavimaribacter sediminis]MBW8639208.1 GntR family transcriptional regulator [Flavimaribacter sediminis]
MSARQKYMTKSEIAAQFIQEQILSGEAPAGTQITTKAVSSAIGMSETPVREAIKSLAAEGWLTHAAHHGTVVATLNSGQISEIFELRGLLNQQAVKRGQSSFGAERMAKIDENIARSEKAVADNDHSAYSGLNREFHDLLCNTPEAEWTYRMFSILQGQSAVFRHGFRAIPDGLRKSLDAHLAIREALAKGHFEDAARLAYEDEVSAGQRLIDTLRHEDGQDHS